MLGRYDSDASYKVLSLVSFLDPRFKNNHLENKEDVIYTIIEKCIASYVCSPTAQDSGSGESPPPAKKLKGLAAVLTHMEDQPTAGSNVLSPREKINLEISSYLDIPTLEIDADPLFWWRIEHLHFANLAQLSRKYLSICGTSVPSERLFSLAGHILNSNRGRLLPENVNKLVFLAKNM